MTAAKKQAGYSIYVDEELCKGVENCGICIHMCPKDVYVKSVGLTRKGLYSPIPEAPDACIGCMICVDFCPDLAIVVESRNPTAAEAANTEQEGNGA